MSENRVVGVTSDTIKVARVVCIIFMMTTHVWPGAHRILQIETSLVWQAFYWVVVDLMGRASLPLLSTIAGLLLAVSLRRRPGSEVASIKFQTLILPMALWSIPIIAITQLAPLIGGWGAAATPAIGLDNFLSVTRAPANAPLHFLRDLFLISLYGIGILWIARRNVAAVLLSALVVIVYEHSPFGILFRNQIATFFLIGLIGAFYGFENWSPRWWLVIGALITYLGLLWAIDPIVVSRQPVVFEAMEYAKRFAMGLFVLKMARVIASSNLSLRSLSLQIEPHIFVVFCLHAIVIKLMSGIAYAANWDERAPIYLLIFVAQIVLCVGLGVVVSRLLSPFPLLRGKTIVMNSRSASSTT